MGDFAIRQGDALDVLRSLPDESVNMCVTSPPYWGLRDYGVEGKLGLEETPEAFVAALVGVFSELRRVLTVDGTLWINMGDSYTATAGSRGAQGESGQMAGRSIAVPRLRVASINRTKRIDRDSGRWGGGNNTIPQLGPKNLIGMPWRVAFALQADGWLLRQDIIWHKPNPMPESVKDRCTKSHEYIFLLSKSAKYFYNADAIREPVTSNRHARGAGIPSGWDTGPGAHRTLAGRFRSKDSPIVHGNTPGRDDGGKACNNPDQTTRNKRSVWTIPTQATPEAHFATFPLEIPELCIRAGCKEGGTVLDPFAGAGTTGLACLKLDRNFLGIELKPEYIEIANSRARRHFSLLMGAAV